MFRSETKIVEKIHCAKFKFFHQYFFPENRINVCLGKEWYRYPSSFFLPAKKWNVKFLQSEFKGQLPQPFLTDHELATAIERPNFNDLNLEEVSRYVKVTRRNL